MQPLGLDSRVFLSTSLHYFTKSSFIRRALIAGLMVIVATAMAGAQVIPIPLASTVGGLAPGSGNTQCTAGYATAPVGSGPLSYGDGCPSTQATLNDPYSVATDSLGNVYIADYNHFELRVIYNAGSALAAAIVGANPWITNLTPKQGYMYLLAGGSREASLVKTGLPSAYYCNSAGTGPIALSSTGNGCPGGYAFIKPRQLVVDKDGNVFFANISGGTGIKVFYVGGTAAANLIRLENIPIIPQPGYIYSVAGSGSSGQWNGDGGLATATTVYFGALRGVAVDANEDLFISDGTTGGAANNDIRVVAGPNTTTLPNIGTVTPGYIYTLAGGFGCMTGATSCPFGNSGDGGPATKALFNSPYDIVTDAYGNVYVGDYTNARVRAIYMGSGTLPGVSNPTTGYIYTVAGGGSLSATPANINNLATQLVFGTVKDIGVDLSDNVYLADVTSQYLWRVDAKTGIATIVSGIGTATAPTVGNYCSGASGPKSVDSEGDGCPATQSLDQTTGAIAFDLQGNFFHADYSTAGLMENVVRKYSFGTQFPATAVGSSVTQTVAIQAVAATTLTGESFLLENGATAEFTDAGSDTCTATASLAASSVCVFNVMFTPAQVGLRMGTQSFAYSGGPMTNFLSGVGQAPEVAMDPGTQTTIGTGLKPNGVTTDLNGNLYISDLNSNSVLKVATSGGTPSTLISGLNSPSQVAVDHMGNVYVADTGNNRIAMTGPTGGTITALGTGLNAPQGVAVDGEGNVYVADTGNARVVRISGIAQVTLSTYNQTSTTQISLITPARLALDSLGNLYVADKGGTGNIVEWNTQGTVAGPTSLYLGTSTFSPTGLAVDAAGDVYVSDSTNLQVVIYPMVSGSLGTNYIPEVTGLTTPVGVAIDTSGSIYVADNGAPGAIALSRTLGTINFPATVVNSTSTKEISFTDVGNASLIFSIPGSGNNPSISGGYTFGAGLTCPQLTSSSSSVGTLATGASCIDLINFAPASVGTYNGSLVLTDNNLNSVGGTQSILLSGTAITPPLNHFAFTTEPATSTTAGSVFTVAVTAYSSTGNSTVSTYYNGPVTVTSTDGAAVLPTSVAWMNGVATFQVTLKTAGTQTITLAATGGSPSATSTSVQVSAGAPAMLSIISGNGQSAGINAVFAAPLQVQVTDTYGNYVSGVTVSFSAPTNGPSATLSSATCLTGSNGECTAAIAATAIQYGGAYIVNATVNSLSNSFILTNIASPLFLVTAITDPTSGSATRCPNQNVWPVTSGLSCALRDAIAAAAAAGGSSAYPSIITFAQTSATTINIGSTGIMTIPSNTTIRGATIGSGTTQTNLITVSGQKNYPIFQVASGTVNTAISNLIIANGYTSATYAPAIHNRGALTLSNSTITGNSSSYMYGGAVYNASTGTMTINGCTFTGNTANTSSGGAIYNSSGYMTINNSTLTGNTASVQGGAIDNVGSTGFLTVNNSTITGNSTQTMTAGGIATANINVAFNNSILAANDSSLPYQCINNAIGCECSGAACTPGKADILFTGTEQQVGGVWDSGTITISFTDSLNNTYTASYAYGQSSTTSAMETFLSNTSNNTYSGSLTTAIYGSKLLFQLTNGATLGTFTITNPSTSFTLTTSQVYFSGVGNVVGHTVSNLNLTSLGSYGGPTQSIMPLPGSAALCVAPASTTSLTTDQRSLPRTTSYNGTACVDSGAVQTNYSVQFAQQPTTTQATVAIAPSPTVNLLENGSVLNVSGASLSMAVTTGTLNGTTTQTTNSSGLATFSGLSIAGKQTSDTLIASAAVGANAVTATSSPFNVLWVDHYVFTSVPVAATAGNSFNVTVTAYLDSAGTMVATAYNGPVNFTSSDVNAVLPSGPQTLTAGTGIFNITLKTVGAQTITVTNGSGTPSSTSGSVTVNPPVAATQNLVNTSLTQNYAALPFTPVSGSYGTGILSYSVLPTLPAGLTLSASTGAITGTATVVSPATTYTVTVTDSLGATATATFSLTVNAAVAATQAVATTLLTQNYAAASFTPVTGSNGTGVLSYSVSPTLPMGLSMSSTTGAITGTATASSSSTTYTITVTDSLGATATATFSLTVNAAVAATQKIATTLLTQNYAATAFTPVTATGGTGTLTYSVTPTLPTGLSMSTSTGSITGTATVVSSATTYTVTVTDANGAAATKTFSMTVNAAVTATQAVATTQFTQNKAATSVTPTTGSNGTGTLSYSVSPTLPIGLMLSTTTGAITGTPTVTSSATTYTVTVTDTNGATATATFSLTVNAAVSATQTVASASLTAGYAAISYTPVTATGGTGTLTYSVTPTLPTGLSMSNLTGAITGAAAESSSAITYTVTATDTLGASDSSTFSLTVNAAVTAALKIASTSLTAGYAASSFTPVSATGGTGALNYSVTPALPASLSFSSTTGAITGTASGASSTATYTVKAADTLGASSTATFSLTVNAAVTATQKVATTSLTQNYAAAAITPVTGANGTGTLSYSVSPALPAGLLFSTTIGAITGAPTAISSMTTYTVSVADANGATATASFSLTVNTAVSATQTVATTQLTQNKAATAFTPVTGANGTGTLNYSVSPTLPTGLTLSTTTGGITGTPTVINSATTYTVTVTDTNGATATKTFSLTVNAAVTATQSVATTQLTQNHTATSFTPVTGSNGTGTLSYNVSPTLPTGLMLSTTTGGITGTPTVTSSATTYTVTVTDTNGATNTATFSVTVNAEVTATQTVATTLLTQNKAATAFTPVTGSNGTGTLNYGISPALPTGLSFSTSTGAITGTATVVSSTTTTYTVTVTDANGATAAKTFSLTVNAAVTATQAVATTQLTQYKAATSFTPVTGANGTGTLSYGVSPTLPTGLSFSTSTGSISGTATVTSSATTYTVTVTDTNSATATATFSLTVNTAVSATQAVATTSLVYNAATTAFTPVTGSGGTGALSYSVSPVLPTGLSLSSATGTITGTPTAVSTSATYTVTVIDANSATASNTFSLTVGQASQAITAFAPSTPVTYGVTPIALTATGGASGNPVTFNIVSGPGSLSGTNNSTLTVTGVGTIVVAANQAGNTNYTPAIQVTVSIVVNKATLTVTANNIIITYGQMLPAYTAVITGFVNVDTVNSATTGTASLTTSPTTPMTAGTYPITATQGTLAATNYSFSYANGALTINKAATAVSNITQTIPTPSGSVGTGVIAGYSVTVSDAASNSSGTPTGTVQFYNGTNAIGTPITLVSGVASITTTFTTAQTASITAVYSGDSNFSTSGSGAFSESVVTPGYTVSANPTTLIVTRGTTGTVTLTFTPYGNYQGTASYSCTGLPAYSSCTFTPTTITFSGNNVVHTSMLQFTTTAPSVEIGGSKAALFWLPALIMGGLLMLSGRRLPPTVRSLLMLLVLTCMGLSLSGCGGRGGSPGTPTGTDNVVVNVSALASSGTGFSNLNQTTSITITIQ